MKAPIALPLLLLLGGCFAPFECENEVLQTSAAPSGGRAATVFERNCGATTSFTTNISILEAGQVPSDSGNVWLASGGSQERGGPWAEVRWLSANRLLVRYDRSAVVAKVEAKVDGVEVVLDPVSRF